MKRVAFITAVFVLTVVIVFKSVKFDGGIILGEPDAFVHSAVVTSLINTGIPAYEGRGFYFDLPAYFATSAVFSNLLFHNPLVALRFVSFLATTLTALIIFFYLFRKENIKTATLGVFVYFMIPLAWFYLRVGVIEPFLVFGMVGTFCFFDLARSEKDITFSILSGLFLGLSFLTKYSILPIFGVMVVYFVYDLFAHNKNFLNDKYLHLSLFSSVPLVLGLLLFLPIFYFFYKLDPETVKWQTLQVLGFYGGVKQEFRPSRLLEFPWWFSWPIVVLASVGAVRSLINYKKYLPVLLFMVVMLFAILSRLPFYPRYALVLVPFLALFGARGLSLFKSPRTLVVFVVFIFGVNILPIVNAYRSADQRLIEDSVVMTRSRGSKLTWAFSNYWPNYFGKLLPVNNYAWLTYDSPDLRAFAPGESRNALQILNEDGGVVFVENLYADLVLTHPQGRLQAINEVKKSYKPTFSVRSTSPNFPHSKKFGDTIDVYIFPKL
jgi:hypothetical protein